ncbi:aquaporin Z [Psychrobacter sp. FDAARGOS_221]|uniref:aquaporin Z n=1 Tax=Psychrobacter sp. FDAARGOS_221 TaxID=1975705 RepID=UPI000BB5897C|nr:aquaporin Z [Psychrobacter sp. FDAARGOS_221]PNK60178.1 aquaporin Z [Psychrobacter sp. FDAARGOS_221]
MTKSKKLAAEFLGTMWLVLGGCGSAIFAANFGGDGNPLGIGFVGVALAFGLTVLTGAYAFGHISGGHFNPAVSIGLMVGKRFPASELPGYIIAQVLGGAFGAFIIYMIATGQAGFAIDASSAGAFATNGFGEFSPGGYSMMAALIAEVVLTAVFLIIIMGSTHHRAPIGFAPIAIGLGLTLIHLISIPITNTSVNPARSTAVALFVGGESLSQLWLFWVAPIIGAVIGGGIYTWLGHEGPDIVGGVDMDKKIG